MDRASVSIELLRSRMSFHTTESYPFGSVTLSCAFSPASDHALNVQRIELAPELPVGKSVDLIVAYRIVFNSPVPAHDFFFDIELAKCQSKGNRESGEHLEAQSWSIGNGRLVLGTEDGEALKARMPWLQIQRDDYPIEYLDHGFRMVLPYIASGTTVGFHFVLAYNPTDMGCDSEWLAVDVPHSQLSKFPCTKQWPGIDR